jgi:5'-phosphate synthase pdxT subunit
MKAGVLALQGDFHAHGRALERLGLSWRPVRNPEDFEGIRGLVIPGGESTTLLKLLTPECRRRILDLHGRGGAIFGTCAGALLLAREVRNPRQDSLKLLDAVMVRNGYGRQNESFVLHQGEDGLEGEEVPRELVFIRAPLFRELGPGVRVLAKALGAPVYVQQGNVLAATFHPELSADPSVHQRFSRMMQTPAPPLAARETSVW